MTPRERAAEIGAEDGRKAAETWWADALPEWREQAADHLRRPDLYAPSRGWPVPDLSGEWLDGLIADEPGLDGRACALAYSAAFTAAVEQTIREAVES